MSLFFNDLLIRMKTHPQPIYELDPLNDTDWIQLSENEIRDLVDFAILHQPKVFLRSENKTLDLLTLLLSMGTQSDVYQKDPFLGYKDERIESYIIEQAKIRVKSLKKYRSKSAVFGLSGNPPTMNHLIFIQHLIQRYETTHIILNASSPLKNPNDYVSGEVRFEMLQAMLQAEHVNMQKCFIERLELDRAPPSRMIGTLSLLILKTEDSLVKKTLILGLDCLDGFQNWYHWAQYGELCELKFYPRIGMVIDLRRTFESLRLIINQNINVTLVYNLPEQKVLYDKINALLGYKITILEENIALFQGSSTELRAYYAANAFKHNKLPPNIHPMVDDIIKRRKLFW